MSYPNGPEHDDIDPLFIICLICLCLLILVFFSSCASLPGLAAKGALDEGLRHTRPIQELHKNIDETEHKLERFQNNFESFAQSHRDMVTDMFGRIRLIQVEMHEMHQLILQLDRRSARKAEEKPYRLVEEPSLKKEEEDNI